MNSSLYCNNTIDPKNGKYFFDFFSFSFSAAFKKTIEMKSSLELPYFYYGMEQLLASSILTFLPFSPGCIPCPISRHNASIGYDFIDHFAQSKFLHLAFHGLGTFIGAR